MAHTVDDPRNYLNDTRVRFGRADRYIVRAMMRLLICGLALFVSVSASAAEQVTRETFGSGGRTRTYYLFIPDSAKASPPLIVLLHGSGRNGKSLIEPWRPLARKEGIALAAPDATTPEGWRVPEDGPDFLHDLVELVVFQKGIDPRRVYLFGHSAGAGHALAMAVMESQYFAAVTAHAGTLQESLLPIMERAARKTPIAIWVGTDDALFPLPAVRATRDALKASGFDAKLTELAAHTHDYYGRAPYINEQVWTFLRQHVLPAEPVYERYQFSR
jgi:poly(3-hydroxybutyrate) depolymerase